MSNLHGLMQQLYKTHVWTVQQRNVSQHATAKKCESTLRALEYYFRYHVSVSYPQVLPVPFRSVPGLIASRNDLLTCLCVHLWNR